MTSAFKILAAAAALLSPLAAAADMLDGRGLARAQHGVVGAPVDVGIPAPSSPRVFILNLHDGMEVVSPVRVEFGLLGMMVAPAGEVEEGYGHHHLLVDASAADLDLAQPIPADDSHIHFGDGARATEITLAPGVHTLQLVMGDGNHVPHDPPVISAPVRITVVGQVPPAASTM
ncbi:DUF4399 domain-containing protein [Rubrimonas cliftonensis]|uniref:DUF4399 domain-containing protein n=1 Tax=Rubrimonas cliftonensis TaxID=89524 RepID=A0A1H3W0T5_9RHOB|nr:DUF4399 domain-containing protein [Rubrimonas cliftonensis]SDZ79942.1 protein of unknown function [Rubrimonas cliftonensis]